MYKKVLSLLFISSLLGVAAKRMTPNVYAIDVSTPELHKRNAKYVKLIGEILKDSFTPPITENYAQRRVQIDVEANGSISQISQMYTIGSESFQDSTLQAIQMVEPLPPPDKARRIELVFENLNPWPPETDDIRLAVDSE